jgi:hypothetical protein
MQLDAIIILVSFVAGYAFDNIWAFTVKRPSQEKDKHSKFIVRRIRIHHNFMGYALVVLGLFFYPLYLMPAGLGIIAGHKIRDNLFRFIEVLGEEFERGTKSIEQDVRKGRKKIKKKLKKELS